MTISLSQFAENAYRVLHERLKEIRARYREDKDAGAFWANALRRINIETSIPVNTHWFETGNASPVSLEFKHSRFAYSTPVSYCEPILIDAQPPSPVLLAIEGPTMLQAIEVA